MPSFTLGNLVFLCMKIINSVVVVGLYYGFLTTFSLGPSYLFLLRARVLDENLDENKGKEGTEKKIAATTGFIAGQLMMFVSIYYAPFHVALGRPHTITFLALPYLLFHFLLNNTDFFDYEYTPRNKMRNLGIQCVFLNNFIFQLFNNFLLPSSMLARLVNIYMFRCNNTMLFVTSSFFGWLIGHILFMKWVGLIVVWIKQNYRSNILIRSKKSQYYYKFFIAEWRHYRPGIVSMILVIICIYHLGRMPAPFATYKLEEIKGMTNPKQDEEEASLFSEEGEALDKINKDDELKVRTYYKRVSENLDGNKENSNLDFFKKKKEDYYLWFEKPFVTLLFDYNKRSRPNRYIRSIRAERAVRNEISQFFFFTCRSDGKERISFTYPPSLSTFFKMIQKKIPSFTREKASSDRISTCWSLINEEKRENLKKEFVNRIEALDKEWSIEKVLEKTTRFCHNEIKKEYLPKIYDPFLYGIYRGRIKRLPPFLTETYIKKNIGGSWINKIHGILLNINSQNFDQTIAKYHRKYFEKFNRKSFKKKRSFLSEPQEEKINSEEERKIFKFLFDVVITDSDYKTLRKNFLYLHKIKKEVPRWRYKLRTELEGVEPNAAEGVITDPQIRSRRSKRIVFCTEEDPDDITKIKEVSTITAMDLADYRRQLIRGSMRSQRRKTYIWGLYHPNVHSRVFFDRVRNTFDTLEDFFYYLVDISDIGRFIKQILRDLKRKRQRHKLLNEKSIEELKQELKEIESRAAKAKAKAATSAEIDEQTRAEEAEVDFRDQACVRNEENWVELQHGIQMRTAILLTISILRRYIIPPLLITIKNCIRILLREVPEWSEDFRDWKREVHFICNSTGGLIPKGDLFPIDWYTEGIQIKVVYPFYLKPWHKSKFISSLEARLKKIKDKLKKIKKKKKDKFEKREDKFEQREDKFEQREDEFEQSETGFLTVFGKLADLPYGPAQERAPFFHFLKPVYKELKKRIKKLKLLKNFKERAIVFLKVAKELKNWIIETLFFITEKDPSKKKKKRDRFDLRETYELKLNETKKDSIMSNRRVDELSVQNKFMDWTNEKEKEFLIDKIKILRNQIEEISKEKQQLTITQTNSCKKPRYGSQIIQIIQIIESLKNFLETFDRKKNRLTRKFFFYFSFYFEQLSLAIFLGIINITRITITLFVESTKKFLEKSIYKNEETSYKNEETGYKNEETGEKSNKKKNTISFISTIKNLISKKKKFSYDLSQAYVFYKLSQMKVGNFSKLKAVLEYNICITSFFVKNQIKGFFQDQGIFHYELKDKTFFNSEVNQWKNWLRSHYQYNLPQIVWARLVTKKWKKKINQDSIVINPSLTKEDSCEKKIEADEDEADEDEADEDEADEDEADEDEADEYEANEYEAGPLLNLKLKKDSIYNLFCYKSIHSKENFFDMSIGIALDNRLVSCFLEKYNIRGMGEIRHRKYFDCRILNFWFRKKVNMESGIDTKSKRMKTKVQNSQRIDKITKTGLANKKIDFFNWMGMNEEILNRPIKNNEEILNRPIKNNEEILNRPIKNFELFFFPEFLLFSSTYKTKPWVIPIKLLLFNFNENKKSTKNIPSNDKEFLQFDNLDELARQRELEADKEKRIAEIYLESGKTRKKTTENFEKTEHIDSVFAKFSYSQLRWSPIYFSKMGRRVFNFIRIMALIFQLEKPRKLVISSIKRGDLDPELLFFVESILWKRLKKRGIFFIEPIRTSVQNDGQLIIYRTISISLVHKNKQKTSKRYKKKIEKSITKSKKKNVNKKKKNYDFFVPEKILPPKRRREFRILTCLNVKKKNARDINSRFDKNVENLNTVLHKKKDLDKEKKNLIKFKYFLWPNFRLEDLACINRYWFNTTNGNRFSMIRMHMYKRFKN